LKVLNDALHLAEQEDCKGSNSWFYLLACRGGFFAEAGRLDDAKMDLNQCEEWLQGKHPGRTYIKNATLINLGIVEYKSKAYQKASKYFTDALTSIGDRR